MTGPGSDSAVVLEGVAREVPTDNGPVRILDDVDLRVAGGGLLTIVGPSGAGKTALIRLLNRLDDADAGRIEVLGQPVDQWPVRELRRRVAMVFQQPTLMGLSVRENLRLPLKLVREPERDFDRRAAQALELAGLDRDFLDREASGLSVGQMQRVAIARALMAQPQILLLDEPTAALDRVTADRLLQSISALRQADGQTVIMVTHRLEEAERLDGDTAVLLGGRVAAIGPTRDLMHDPPAGEVADFLKGETHDD